MIGDWIEILMPYPRAALDAGCTAWLRDQPRLKPRPGDVLAKARGWLKDNPDHNPYRQALPPPEEPKRDRVTAEAAARILQEAGMDEKRLMLVKRFPSARSVEHALELAEQPQVSPIPPADPDKLRKAREGNEMMRKAMGQ